MTLIAQMTLIVICVILQSAKICGSDIICHPTEERVRRIVDLSRRDDRILEAPMLDLEGLAVLADDCEAANMPCAAAALRRRVERYRARFEKENQNVIKIKMGRI